jgi:alkylation response protein AidB-like acyl-CoA dehydrogenase
MDLLIPPADQAWQERAKNFAETILFPQELELELNGSLSRETKDNLRAEVIKHGFAGINHSTEVGGKGCTQFQQTLINEELGKATGALWAAVWHPAVPLKHGTKKQIEEYLRPSCEGKRRACVAITEPDAGSDTNLIKTTARRRGDRYVIDGEKWFVTSGDEADYIIVHALIDGDISKPTLFLVDRKTPGLSIKREPKFTHNYIFGHPEFVFQEVEVSEECILGGVGMGLELTKDWFVEARLQIAANCLGAAIRGFELANDWANRRVQFGVPIRSHQAIDFMLADMAVEIMAAKSMIYRVAWEIDQKIDRKIIHARASVIKLHASEMAGRVLDKAVQIFGGRGYMRENAVERLNRDVRVDRIWEGTSEIQRVIIGGQLAKRGTGIFTDWHRSQTQ